MSQILETKSFAFVIDLAALASRREYLNLEKWLQEHIRQDGEIFIRACLEFLNEKVILAQGRADGIQSVSLDVASNFIRIIHAYSG